MRPGSRTKVSGPFVSPTNSQDDDSVGELTGPETFVGEPRKQPRLRSPTARRGRRDGEWRVVAFIRGRSDRMDGKETSRPFHYAALRRG